MKNTIVEVILCCVIAAASGVGMATYYRLNVIPPAVKEVRCVNNVWQILVKEGDNSSKWHPTAKSCERR